MEITSTNPSQLAEALAKAQAEIIPPKHNCSVDFEYQGKRTNYTYADLAAIMAAITPALSKNGLAVTQRMIMEGPDPILITELRHLSGEILSTTYPLPNPSNLKPQVFGTSLTYARRYSICGLVAVAAEEDKDGQNAEPPAKTRVINSDPVDPNYGKEPKEFREARERREAAEREAAQTFLSQEEFNALKNTRGTVGVTKLVDKVHEVKNYAPGAADRVNELDAFLTRNVNPEVENYRITFGKFNGKSLKEIGLSKAKDYATWIIGEAKKKGQVLPPGAQKFCDIVDLALSGLS